MREEMEGREGSSRKSAISVRGPLKSVEQSSERIDDTRTLPFTMGRKRTISRRQ